MTSTQVRVVKVGGSLLSWEQLPHVLPDWLERQEPMPTVLLAGGGEFADAVRAAEARFGLGDEASHWICIDLLRPTARLLASLLPAAKLVRRWSQLSNQLDAPQDPALIVLDPVQFVCEVEPEVSGEKLPATWDASSDSIAARVAAGLNASELVLLKSANLPSATTLESVAEASLVDKFFPRAAETLACVRVVSLRSPAFDEAAMG